MSRSYKKPYVTQQQHSRSGVSFWKRLASRRVRDAEDVADGKAYRRFYNPWNISDWAFWSDDPKARRK